jgi:nucleoid-associated protein YgaU
MKNTTGLLLIGAVSLIAIGHFSKPSVPATEPVAAAPSASEPTAPIVEPTVDALQQTMEKALKKLQEPVSYATSPEAKGAVQDYAKAYCTFHQTLGKKDTELDALMVKLLKYHPVTGQEFDRETQEWSGKFYEIGKIYARNVQCPELFR